MKKDNATPGDSVQIIGLALSPEMAKVFDFVEKTGRTVALTMVPGATLVGLENINGVNRTLLKELFNAYDIHDPRFDKAAEIFRPKVRKGVLKIPVWKVRTITHHNDWVAHCAVTLLKYGDVTVAATYHWHDIASPVERLKRKVSKDLFFMEGGKWADKQEYPRTAEIISALALMSDLLEMKL